MGTGVSLLEIDRKPGTLIAERHLEDDVWNIAVGRLPANVVPQGYSTPAACTRPIQ
ncbi:MAG TPA: hypothetical protein VKU19_09475 [Bryobacteraceae bacterium]|nr:hypothetical protein [Bryobacteraceae bacterium]